MEWQQDNPLPHPPHHISNQLQILQPKDPPSHTVLLNNFQFHPSHIQLNAGATLCLKIQQNNRQYSQVYDDRAFVMAIEELEIESPPLRAKDVWMFTVDVPGKYQLVCLNYCKLSLGVEVFQLPCSPVLPLMKETPGCQGAITKEQPPRDNYEAFTYEEFQSLICSEEIDKFDDIPHYLLRCFKTELSILQNTKCEEKTDPNTTEEKRDPNTNEEKRDQTPKQSVNNREHSTNIESCSVCEELDESRIAGSPAKGKALTIFEYEERGDFQSRALKKTSSQVIALEWKEEKEEVLVEPKVSCPSSTFEEESWGFLQNNQGKIQIPKCNPCLYEQVLVLLQNRLKICELSR